MNYTESLNIQMQIPCQIISEKKYIETNLKTEESFNNLFKNLTDIEENYTILDEQG